MSRECSSAVKSTGETPTQRPDVSICLMTYNGAATVKRAVATLLNQTHRNFELIISDDHSNDDTLSICHEVAANDNRVRFIHPPHNLGGQSNMRFALSHARGKYFLWASQDDYWEPKFIGRLFEALQSSPGAVCAMCRARKIWPDGKTLDAHFEGRDLPDQQSYLKLAIATLAIRSWEGAWQEARHGIFIHGLLERNVFNAVLKSHGRDMRYERQIIAHLALAGRILYVDDLLFYKMKYHGKLHERRAANEPSVVAQRESTKWRYLSETLVGIARSPVVPAYRRFVSVPLIFVAYWWYHLVQNPLRRLTRKAIQRANQFVFGPIRRHTRKAARQVRNSFGR